MADFTTANLEGANELFNKTATDAKALKDQLVAQHGADASTMKAAVESKVADLQTSLSSMIPELPNVPNVNMQGEFAVLMQDFTGVPAVADLAAMRDALKDKGLDIDSLATEIQAGGDVGDLIPNLQLADGESIPIELPSNISIPSFLTHPLRIVFSSSKLSKSSTSSTPFG